MGRNPKDKNIFMITGDSGNGLTHGTIGALLITDLILAKKNPYEDLYKLKRLPLRALGTFFKNIFSSSRGYLRYLIPQFGREPNKGEGKILQRGFKKMAVYKDENGKIKQCSAV